MAAGEASRRRFLAFDGLRGLLSLLVILSHFPAYTVLHHTRFAETGASLIDLFFVFSGFVIIGAFERPLSQGYGIRRFIIERLGRIYPVHFAMLLLFVATELAMMPLIATWGMTGREAFSDGNAPGAIVSNLLLIQSLNLHDGLTWNYPAWSLSTEWAAYVLFALTMAVGGRSFLPWALVWIAGSIGVLTLIAPEGMLSTYDYGLFRSTYGFAAGGMAFYAYHLAAERKWFERVPAWLFSCAEASMIGLLFALQLQLGNTPYAFIITLGHMVILFVFAFEGGIISRVMQNPVLVYLGAISLSTYIIHMWVLMRIVNVAAVVEKLTGIDLVYLDETQGAARQMLTLDPAAASVFAIVVVLVVIGLAHLSYRFIELPGQKLFRDIARRYRPQSSKASGGETPRSQPA